MTASPHPSAEHPLPQAVLRPVRGHHAFEACVEQLGTAIRLGVYPLGTTLPAERDLAARLQVSRATLREAMAALREAGLVETRRGRGGGTVVTLKAKSPSARAAARLDQTQRRDWLDALDYRRIVEPGAAWLAARAELSADRRAELERAHADVAVAKRPAAHRQADSRFHLTVASLADSPRVIEAVTSVQSTLHEMLLAIPVLEANIGHSDRQHAALVKAIVTGDAERARKVMEEHCDDTAALLRGLVG
ncbi:FCD domain-containing protein [Nocardioides endophyticus]|uniref:FCD domain-containing protein n=1 Tax=Nocardioides endophyticus TaxID=1353775 RepID=A0ABP8Z300_9ACTN